MLFKDTTFGKLKIKGNRPFLIAEVGVNHENDIDIAFQMIEKAAESGCDAVKFQSYKAGTIASRYSPSYWDLTKEPTNSQHELFLKHDKFGIEEYKKLSVKARDCNIWFMSTPFDNYFAKELAPLMPVYKIASADITNHPFLEYCASFGKPIIISTGASTIGEVEKAIEVLKNSGVTKICIMHCILSYPTEPINANLRVIEHLKSVFPDVMIGYSDHVPPYFDCLTLTTSWLLGARIIEKHFTLDKILPGNDHYHAMDPDDVINFRKQCDFVNNLLGSNVKKVFDCEINSRLNARRSLILNKGKSKGEVITTDDIDIKRPGNGIAPEFLDLVLGKKLITDVKEDEVLLWEMFIS
jgi:sialic acid synthase SpsE